jgi:hypothetical protein
MQINSRQIASGRLLRRHHHVDLPSPAPRAAHYGTRNNSATQPAARANAATIPFRTPAIAQPVIVVRAHWLRDCPLPRIIDLSHRVERGVGVLLPDELDVALRDLPGERLVRNAKVERVEPPLLSAIRQHIAMCIFNQPHHGPTYRVRAEANAISTFITSPSQ